MAGLIFIEPKSKMENDLIHLSKLGIEITAEYFANDFKKANSTDFSSLTKLQSVPNSDFRANWLVSRGITAKTT